MDKYSNMVEPADRNMTLEPGSTLQDRQPEVLMAVNELFNENEMLTNATRYLMERLSPVLNGRKADEPEQPPQAERSYGSDLARTLGDQIAAIKRSRETIDTIIRDLEV